MPRRSTISVCKICGGQAVVKKYSSKGSNGKIYYYEKYTHKNGVEHYYRDGKRFQRADISDSFRQMISTKMARGNYRFRDIKSLFESIYKSNLSNTTLSRNLERVVKMNLLEKMTNGNITYYRKVEPSDSLKDLNVIDASLNFRISGNKVSATLFLYFKNSTDRLLTSIPIVLPSGSSESIESLNLIAHDQDGVIDRSRITAASLYPGQLWISTRLTKVLKPMEKNFMFLQFNFETNEESIKFALPVNFDSFGLSFTSNRIMEFVIRRRLLDGIKESNPDIVKRGTLERGDTYTYAEFDKLLKGETIVISWQI
ncbi:MAG: hypothetical protein QXU18_09860 [Thermoplasmatales archaeon]